MRNASGYQSENERQWKNRVNRNTNLFSKKRVNRRLKEDSRFSRAKHLKGNIQKSVLHEQSCFLLIRKKCAARAKFFFFLLIRKKLSVLHVQSCCRCCCCCLLIRSIVALFYRSRCFHPVSGITILDFIFSLRKLSVLKRASLSALAKSIYYHDCTTFQTNNMLLSYSSIWSVSYYASHPFWTSEMQIKL